MKIAALLAAALACGLGSQGLLRPRALAARSCWPRDSHENLGWKHAAPVVGRELVADILWAKTLVYYGDGRIRQSGSVPRELPLACSGKDLPGRSPDPRCAPCGLAWDRPDFRYLEPLLDAIVDVDPRFKRVYRWAAFAVTFRSGTATQEEYLASLRYLEAAMERYPDDPEYFWLAGSRYFVDLRSDDPEKERMWRERGADLIEQAMRKADEDQSRNYAELAASYNSQLGRLARARQNLMESIATVEAAATREKLLEKLRRYEMAEQFADLLRDFRVAVRGLRDPAERARMQQAVGRYEPPNVPPALDDVVAELRPEVAALAAPEERAHLSYLLDQALTAPSMVEELQQFFADLEKRRRATLPFASPSLYFILGDPSPKVIDFDDLATERDLFGAEQP